MRAMISTFHWLSTGLMNMCSAILAVGVAWSVRDDEFVVRVDIIKKPFTKRSILSVINSIFDPVGMVSPVVLKGRLIQR